MLGLDELRSDVESGAIDTVVVAFTDMQGRLMGKRLQADFFLETVKPEADDLIALDLESEDATKHMSFDGARVFIKRIKEKIGRYPLVYANNEVTKAIACLTPSAIIC